MVNVSFRAVDGTLSSEGIVGVFGLTEDELKDIIVTFINLTDCQKNVDALVFLLKDARGDKAIFSRNFGGSDPAFNLVEDRQEDKLNAYVLERRNEGYNIVVGFTKNCLKFIVENHVVSQYQIFLFSTCIKGNCWLCGKPISKSASGIRLLCDEHEKQTWDIGGRGESNNQIVHVNPNHHNKLSFGVEFEISNCNQSKNFLNELQTIISHHKWINTHDGTVFSEFKSPIFYGALPFHWNDRNIFNLFDFCLKQGLIRVDESAGTHLHIGSYDENSPISRPRAIFEVVGNNSLIKQNIEKFLATLEVIIDAFPKEIILDVFGRIFNPFCFRYNVPHQEGWKNKTYFDRHHWISLWQSSGDISKGKTIEFRLPKFKNSFQYQKAYRMGIFIFNAIRKILFENGNPLSLAECFEKKLIKIADEKEKLKVQKPKAEKLLIALNEEREE